MTNCPFCDSCNLDVQEVVLSHRNAIYQYRVHCNECYCSGPIATSEVGAWVLWNKKEQAQALDKKTKPLKELINV